ncbi:Zn-ribbon domain-containing OB-fold protein [Trinickia sp. EG282A]|uniref:Zn-ribbon domain-containing OB-fold protein n=1 Tax=Trinickia sp. EG282A TaxID=3237013 RepID=UPI0034D1D9A4
MTSTVAERVIKDPAINPGDEPYFEATDRGQLLLKFCSSCGRPHHYPRSLCPFCWSSDLSWKQAAGTGEIYAYSVMRRGPGAPYCIAYVTLDEGPKMLTNIVDTDLDTVAIGQRVRVVFKRSESGVAIPMFTPASPVGR